MSASPGPKDEGLICQCVMRLLLGLLAADAELLRQIDLEGRSASDLARLPNLRVNTLNVWLLRARRKLRELFEGACQICAAHGCLDCECG